MLTVFCANSLSVLGAWNVQCKVQDLTEGNTEAILCWAQITICSDELQLIIYIFIRADGAVQPSLFLAILGKIIFFGTSQPTTTTFLTYQTDIFPFSAQTLTFSLFRKLLPSSSITQLSRQCLFSLDLKASLCWEDWVEECAEWHSPQGLSGYKSLPSCLSKKIRTVCNEGVYPNFVGVLMYAVYTVVWVHRLKEWHSDIAPSWSALWNQS